MHLVFHESVLFFQLFNSLCIFCFLFGVCSFRFFVFVFLFYIYCYILFVFLRQDGLIPTCYPIHVDQSIGPQRDKPLLAKLRKLINAGQKGRPRLSRIGPLISCLSGKRCAIWTKVFGGYIHYCICFSIFYQS